MGQELGVGILFELLERLQSFLLELDGFFHVFFAAVHRRDFNVAVSDLLALRPECHLVEFPGLAEDIERRFMVFLSQVDLSDHLENLTVRGVCVAEDLLVHLEGLLEERQGIFVVASLHVAAKPSQRQEGSARKRPRIGLTCREASKYESGTAS